MPFRRPSARTLLLAAALLLAGAAVNVGVAHVCERVQPRPRAFTPRRYVNMHPPASARAFFEESRLRRTPVGIQREQPVSSTILERDVLCTCTGFEHVLGRLRVLNASFLPEPDVRLAHERMSYGLPMRSLCKSLNSERSGEQPYFVDFFRPPGLEGGWPPHWNKRALQYSSFSPPPPVSAILPIPLGFAVNTLFYAALITAPLPLLPAARRRWRLKRGLCPRCAYPLAVGAGQDAARMCSECGWGAAGQPKR